MHIFDIIVLVIIVLFFLKGLKNGFIIELASLAALILGIIIAVKFSGVTADWLSEFITSRFISILAFILVFTGVVIAIHLIARMIDKLMSAIALGWLNRLTGAAFGFLKAAFLISVGIMLLEVFGFDKKAMSPQARDESLLYIPLQKFAPYTLHYLNVSMEHLLPNLEDVSPPPPATS